MGGHLGRKFELVQAEQQPYWVLKTRCWVHAPVLVIQFLIFAEFCSVWNWMAALPRSSRPGMLSTRPTSSTSLSDWRPFSTAWRRYQRRLPSTFQWWSCRAGWLFETRLVKSQVYFQVEPSAATCLRHEFEIFGRTETSPRRQGAFSVYLTFTFLFLWTISEVQECCLTQTWASFQRSSSGQTSGFIQSETLLLKSKQVRELVKSRFRLYPASKWY